MIPEPLRGMLLTHTLRRTGALAALLVALPACRPRSEGAEPADRSASPPVVTAGEPRAATVREVLGVSASAGESVRVRGLCAAAASDGGLGAPPRGGRSWLLSDEGVSVFVVGALPAACGAAAGDSVTIVARVAEDTLPTVGTELPAAPRRYLVMLDR